MPLTITITGTPDPGQPGVLGQYVGGSGVTFRNSGDTDFDSTASIQRSINLFPEVQAIIAGLAAALSVPGIVVVDQLLMCLRDIRRKPNMAERSYQQ